jgi:hypothetical protein
MLDAVRPCATNFTSPLLSTTIVRRAYARTKCSIRMNTETRAREQRSCTQSCSVRRFCACALREPGCVVLCVVLGRDACGWII